MRIRHIFLAAVIALPVLAGDPPPIDPNLLPPVTRPVGHPVPFTPPIPVPDPSGPMTLERLNRIPFSNTVYYAFRRELTRGLTTTATADNAPASAPIHAEHNWAATALSTINSPVQATNDALQDVEPSIVVFNKDGGTHTIVAQQTDTTSGGVTGHINVESTTTLAPGSFSRYILPVYTGYPNSGDQVLAANVYNAGVWGLRAYCVGLMFSSNQSASPSIVGLWHSDDGGVTWPSPPTVVDYQPGGGGFIDKPSIAVSYFPGNGSIPSTLGYVYVTWLIVNTANPYGNSVWVKRSTDGGSTFEPAVVISYDFVLAPQVVVDSNTGDVYCIWVNGQYNDIRMSKSTGSGALSFGPHEIVASGGMITSASDRTLKGGVRASTVPIAKYNWYARRLCVAWHGGTTLNTDIKYAYKPCSLNCNSYQWEQPKTINDVTTNDQFMPGMDYINGNFVIGFYDRREDSSNFLYKQYYAYIASDGTPQYANQPVSTIVSDPRLYTSTTGDPSFIGDYHDLWTWTYPDGTWGVDSWVGFQNNNGDILVSRIQP